MEGVRDAVSLSMTPERWHWSSVPPRDLVDGASIDARIDASPTAAQRRDALVLAAHRRSRSATSSPTSPTPRAPTTTAPGARDLGAAAAARTRRGRPTRCGSGCTYPLDPVGPRPVALAVHRAVGERLQRLPRPATRRAARARPPRQAARRPRRGERGPDALARTCRPNGAARHRGPAARRQPARRRPTSNNEDTGLDGRSTDAERGRGEAASRDLTTASAGDPEGDDFAPPDDDATTDDIDPRRCRCTERHRGQQARSTRTPTPRTSNLNSSLDTSENYFEYTIDLGDDRAAPYLVTDVAARLRRATSRSTPDNGWRRYRIPIADDAGVAVRHPRPDAARSTCACGSRASSTTGPDRRSPRARRPLLMLGGLDIVGSRWRRPSSTPPQVAPRHHADAELGEHRSTTPTSTRRRSIPARRAAAARRCTRREQSLALEFTDLAPGDTLEAFKTFSLDEDYSRYGKLAWYVDRLRRAGLRCRGDATRAVLLRALRLGRAGRNYYEYRAPLPAASTPRRDRLAARSTLDAHRPVEPEARARTSRRRDPILLRACRRGPAGDR